MPNQNNCALFLVVVALLLVYFWSVSCLQRRRNGARNGAGGARVELLQFALDRADEGHRGVLARQLGVRQNVVGAHPGRILRRPSRRRRPVEGTRAEGPQGPRGVGHFGRFPRTARTRRAGPRGLHRRPASRLLHD
jgi:hypothetical protein